MRNNCATVEPGLSGCCCNEDGCLSPKKSPANPLTCFVGLRAPRANVLVGAEVYCGGMCSTLNAMVNGDNVTTFQCVPTSVCKALAADNGCSTLRGDREVTGCCCDTSNACNTIGYPDVRKLIQTLKYVMQESKDHFQVVVPTLPPRPEFPISCWTGIYVNGKALSKPG
ncbi:ET module [Ancylostoma caninum]|uniref:ET module n=1 Tax=Ancylostoma caninum TaxID=29170 RepID=A0A368GGK1_ANCCA|nr:ET module [Ancylostoma caninum]